MNKKAEATLLELLLEIVQTASVFSNEEIMRIMEERMKTCEGCINEHLKNMAWGSTAPHPCTNCSRICPDPLDKYQPIIFWGKFNRYKFSS